MRFGRIFRMAGLADSEAPLRPTKKPLFVFGGASHSWRGPGLELYRLEQTFRATVDAADAQIRCAVGFSTSELFGGHWTARCGDDQRRSDIISMGLLHIGMVDLLASEGLMPEGVLGLSLGEIAAAYASGAVDRDGAIAIYSAIVRHLSARADDHILFVVAGSVDDGESFCSDCPDPLALAGEPIPGMIALLTPLAHSAAAEQFLRGRTGIVARHASKWPYHVPSVPFDAAAAAAEMARICPQSPVVPVYLASCGGRMAPGYKLDAAHWVDMVTGRYSLAGASAAALADGFNVLLNIGTASIDSWVAQAADNAAGVTRLDATPSEGNASAWKDTAAAVRRLGLRGGRRAAQSIDCAALKMGEQPFPVYEAMRRRGPVHYLERHNCWVVLGYDAVRRALFDTERLSNAAYRHVGPVLMADDPPLHRDRRRLIAGLFAPGQIRRHAAETAERARGLMRDELELVEQFARPLAQAAAFSLLEIPVAEQQPYRLAAESFHGNGRDVAAYVARLDGIAEEAGFAQRLLATCTLTRKEACQLIRFLWMAATETTERVIVQVALVLLNDPLVRSQIDSGIASWGALIDEVLRLYPPELLVPRMTTQPIALGGETMPAGQIVMLCLASANRDPARFFLPDTLRLDRAPGRHLSFGGGIHKCAGTALSAPIAEAAVRTLFESAPGLRAAEALDRVPYYRSRTVMTPTRLRVVR